MAERGLVYQCLECGKFDQRGRLQRHIYLCHKEKGNIPFFCSLCNFCTDNLPSLHNHLGSPAHLKHTNQLEGKFNNDSFVSIAGAASIYLQEGRHYKALSAADSEKHWGSRNRPAQRTVTATSTTQEKSPNLTCTVQRDPDETGDGSIRTFDLSDLIQLDETFVDLTKTTNLTPKMTATVAPAVCPPVAGSPAVSLHASQSSSSSNSSCSTACDKEQLVLLKAIKEELRDIRTVNQLKVDVLTAVNRNLADNSRILGELKAVLISLKEEKSEKENKKSKARSRSRSPRRRSPAKRPYYNYDSRHY